MVPLKTNGLTVRALVQDDLEAVFDTLRPETSGGRIFEKKTILEAEGWLHNRMAEQAKLGYSIWAVETENIKLVGVCGLVPWEPVPMICYAIRRQFQGKGFGTKAAKAVAERAAAEFGSVISTIRWSNTASIRVAEKIGMRNSEVSFSDDSELKSFIYP